MTKQIRFAFGRNWQSFVNRIDDQRIGLAMDSLRRVLQMEDLQGKTFLDVGCGSGLFSLAACLLGAERVVSFDYDADSVQATVRLRESSAIPEGVWCILRGDVLDSRFLSALPPADVIYSWGVLHHTGSMWAAVDNVARSVRSGGVLALALYNTNRSSALWRHIKRTYNCMPTPVRCLMEYAYMGVFVVFYAFTLRNPIAAIRNYGNVSCRGMSFSHDIRDWLGGFPYEHATPGAVLHYLRTRYGCALEYLSTVNGLGCNEFMFRFPTK